MNTNLKKALLIFGGGYLLFLIIEKLKPIAPKAKVKKSKSSKTESAGDKKQAATLLIAYREAKKAGEPKSLLDEMNAEFAKEYKMKVHTDKSTGRLFVADLQGNKVV